MSWVCTPEFQEETYFFTIVELDVWKKPPVIILPVDVIAPDPIVPAKVALDPFIVNSVAEPTLNCILGAPPEFSLESTLNAKTSPTAFIFEAMESVPKVISPPVAVMSLTLKSPGAVISLLEVIEPAKVAFCELSNLNAKVGELAEPESV